MMRMILCGTMIFVALLLVACGEDVKVKKSAGGFKNHQGAALVIGQPDLTSIQLNQGLGGADANTTANSTMALVINDRLYVTDTLNHRVLVFNSIPTANNASADWVLGQTGLTTNTPKATLDGMNGPNNISTDGNVLVVVDRVNHRLLVWDPIPTATVAATYEIGGVGVTTCNATTLNFPEAAEFVGGKFIVADRHHNRVLIWNTFPANTGVAADIVLGQGIAGTTCAINQGGAAGLDTMSEPSGIYSDGTRLYVTEIGNHRMLVWDTFPTTTGQAADWIFGQALPTDTAPGVGIDKLNTVHRVTSDGRMLAVADYSNHRMLIWNSLPTSPADLPNAVLGQSNFNNRAPNDSDGDGVTDFPDANTLNAPMSMSFHANHLFVGDPNNNRILMFYR